MNSGSCSQISLSCNCPIRAKESLSFSGNKLITLDRPSIPRCNSKFDFWYSCSLCFIEARMRFFFSWSIWLKLKNGKSRVLLLYLWRLRWRNLRLNFATLKNLRRSWTVNAKRWVQYTVCFLPFRSRKRTRVPCPFAVKVCDQSMCRETLVVREGGEAHEFMRTAL